MPTLAKFVAVPDSVLRDPHLSFPAKLLFGVLRYRQYDKTHCWPSIEGLAKQLGGVSRGTVCRAIRQLEKAGYITIERRHRRSNLYAVRNIQDRTFLRIRLDLVGSPGVSAIDKLLIASLEYKSHNDDGHAYPHQERLARELGCTRSTIFRALVRLEAENKIQVKHRGGGRKRGNFYRLVLERGPEKTVSKRGAKHKYLKELKETAATADFSQRTLSPRDQAYSELLRLQVHPKVAHSIIFEQRHPPQAVFDAIDNAIFAEPVRHAQGKAFRIPNYIIGSLNRARREGHVLTASPLTRRKRRQAISLAKALAQDYIPNERIPSQAKRRAWLDEQKRLIGVA